MSGLETKRVATKEGGPAVGEKLRIPKEGTNAARIYLVSWNQIWGCYRFVERTAEDVGMAQEMEHRRLIETAEDEAERERLSEAWKSRVSPENFLRRHGQFFMEVVLVRHVENYLNYLSDLLLAVFTARPETLKSERTVTYEYVFSHDDMAELRGSLAEKTVGDLSRQSLEDLSKYFWKTFKLTLFTDDSEVSLVTEAVATRNISVHNRCLIDRKYMKQTGAPESVLGTVRELSFSEVEEVADVLAEGVRRIDSAARKKYKLASSRFDVVTGTGAGAEEES